MRGSGAIRSDMRYETEQWVEAPLEAVFRFFCDPQNLLKITPPEAQARIVKLDLVEIGGQQGLAGVGSEIELAFRPIPFVKWELRWTARIVEVEWLRFFRDIQAAGPLRRFVHTHTFHAEARGERNGTVIRDDVDYELGVLGALGSAAARVALWRMFAYRHHATRREMEQH